MDFTIACPSCERNLRVPPSLLGQAVMCPSCSATFAVPEGIEEKKPPYAAPPEAEYHAQRRPSRRVPLEEEEYDEEPRRRIDREKPSKVQAIAVMILVGGIISCLWCSALILFSGLSCCLWPGTYYGLVLGIMAIVRGANLLGDKAYKQVPPYGIANMMIINVINFDMPNLVMGILVLIFLSDEEVKSYFRR